MYLLVDNAVQIVRSGTSQDAKDVVQLKIHSEVFIAWEFKLSILTQTRFIELVKNSKKKLPDPDNAFRGKWACQETI